MSQDLLIEIKDINKDTFRKFAKALDILGKAAGVKFDVESNVAEPTPYKCLRELAEKIYKEFEMNLYLLYSDIVKKWLKIDVQKAKGDSPIKINGKIYINPKTGRALTIAEWKMIQDDLLQAFKGLYGQNKDLMTKYALALGKIVQTMEPDARIKITLSAAKPELFLDAFKKDDLYKEIEDYAIVHTGELITDITSRNRRKVVETIMQGYKDKITSRELRTKLFEDFGELNRDWRRIAETETSINFNNGYLRSEAGTRKKDETIYMKGISGAGACDFCISMVNNKVVVLLDESPKGGEEIDIDGETYTVVWPGKSNYGRKRVDWWVSAGNQHPHCRCTWTRYFPEMADFESKLRQALGT